MFWQVLFEEKRTRLKLHFYSAFLPILKQYVILFQSKDPKVHKLHDEHEILFREFLTCFIKPDLLVDTKGQNLPGAKIKVVNVRSPESHLAEPFVGSEARFIVNQLGRKYPLVKEFKNKIIDAYTNYAISLQKTASGQSEAEDPVMPRPSCKGKSSHSAPSQ